MATKLLVINALCLFTLTFGLLPAQAATPGAGACAQVQSQAAPDSLAQIFLDLQPAKTEKAVTCSNYCAQHPCGPIHPTWVCGQHINTFGQLVCGCYDPSQEGGQ